MKRTNIVLNEHLVRQGKKATGLRTCRALVDFALQEVIRRAKQRRILDLFGAVEWDGNLKQMRSLRTAR